MPDLPDVRRTWQSIGRFWPIAGAACFGLVVAIAAWLAVSIWEERLAKAKFYNVAEDYAAVLQHGLDEYLDKIIDVRAFFDASVDIDANEFALFTNRILAGRTDKMRVTILTSPGQNALLSSANRSKQALPATPSGVGE